MDFTKYVSLLDSKSLFFSRSDMLNDPYEGATSHVNILLRPEVYKDKIPAEALSIYSRFTEWVRQWTYVNCWHMNEHESDAMWRLYTQTKEAVAIQSTYTCFYESVPENVNVGIVNYIDYEKDWLPEGNSLWAFVHKRKSFEHERELRAVIHDLPVNATGFDIGLKNSEYGVLVPVNLEALISQVYISPLAPEWFAALVVKVTKKFGFGFDVNQSLLSKKPNF